MFTGVVLTHNSAATLEKCLSSLNFCDHLLLVDDHSSDDTHKIAHKFNAKILNHSLNGDFSAQRNFALQHISSGWVLFVDSDEVVTSQLKTEILSAIANPSCSAYSIKRIDQLWGRVMIHGDNSVNLVRLAKFDAGTWIGRVHEHWQVSQSCTLHAPLLHYPHPTLKAYLQHINTYSTLRAAELFSQKQSPSTIKIILFPPLKFLHLYIIKLGFLDGMAGFASAFVMSFYTFLVQSKLYLLYRGIGSQHA